MITYSAGINACEKGQKPPHALRTLPKVQLRGLWPDVITHNAATSALRMSQMLHLRGLRPNATTYNAATSACGGASGST